MNLFDRIFRHSADASPEGQPDAAPAVAEFSVQVDRPIENTAEDLFDRAPFARQIANIIAKRRDPSSLVVALYAPWGDGKTSTLTMIKEYLRQDQNILSMDYNPWFYGNNTEAITRSFFQSISRKLQGTKWFTRENVGEVLKNYGDIPYLGGAVRAVGESLSTEELEKIRDSVGGVLRKYEKKIVVFIDDIDRLDRADIQTLFKLVRLSGGFDHATYVLAFDDVIVAEALGDAYGRGDPAAGRKFLEKIIQVPLHLPPANLDTLRQLMFKACDRVFSENKIEISREEGSELGTSIHMAFAYILKTPRQVKLFDNAITFAVPLLAGEVRLVDQIQIEALRVFYPSIYEALRKNPDEVLRARENARRPEEVPKIEQAILDLEGSAEEKETIRDLIRELFPRMSGTIYGDDWDASWAQEKRICSRDYFKRYFTYAVPTGDMSDLKVDQLVTKAVEGDEVTVREMVVAAYEGGAAELLIRKLRQREKTVDLAVAPALIRAISMESSRIPTTEDIMSGDFVFTQAAVLLTRLIERMEPAQQDIHLAEAAEQADTLNFISQLIRFSVQRKGARSDSGFVPVDRIQPVIDILLRRVLEGAAESNVFDAIGNRFGMTAFSIELYGSPEARTRFKDYLMSVLLEEPANALRFLKAVAGRSQGGSGVVTVSDFSPEAYKSLGDLVDVDTVYAQLRTIYGEHLDTAEWQDEWRGAQDVDQRIAEQFSYLHRKPAPNEGDQES
ncbi:P-loop NTPase fold protein [Sphingobium sp. AN641]|uniref:KAP family P-loop NTPase fold protein n=1 Tax=Sphingobium sp. AN641 TaxID=3133443 RepID=UPI0030BD70A7